MENKSNTPPSPLEIPLTSCSNIHLFTQLQIFLQQHKIPLEITSSPTPPQTGGENTPTHNRRQNEPFVYQSAYTPYTLFSQFMDRLFLQKQHENIEDQKNKQILDSIFSKEKSKKEIVQSLAHFTSKQTQPPQPLSREKETKDKTLSTSPKKHQTQKPTPTNTLYIHIHTNVPNPIESIRGTKLYYLYLRQQNGQCAQFV